MSPWFKRQTTLALLWALCYLFSPPVCVFYFFFGLFCSVCCFVFLYIYCFTSLIARTKLGVSSFLVFFYGLIVWDRTLKRERKEWHRRFNGGRKRAIVARRWWWRWRIRIGQWWSWRVRRRTIFSSQPTRPGRVVPETKATADAKTPSSSLGS